MKKNIKEKLVWEKPEIYKLDFKKTLVGSTHDVAESSPTYS